MSGDGGFLFSATELETAVRQGCNFTHIVWQDGYYDMVKEQMIKKYNRYSAVTLGTIDTVKFAESFGATGFKVQNPQELGSILEQAIATQGPSIVEIPIDYRDNPKLFQSAHSHFQNTLH